MKRLILSMCVLAAVSSLPGCHVIETPYVPSGHVCGWDPVFGSCETCGTCGGTCEGHTPGSYLGHLLRCQAGCGQMYWGPWLSDPPDACDPCDDCGNWVGERCCPPKLRHRLVAGLAGGYHGGKGGVCTTCGGKGQGCTTCGGAAYVDESWIDESPQAAPEAVEGESVLPPTPDPIDPASAESRGQESPRGGFFIRSVRQETCKVVSCEPWSW